MSRLGRRSLTHEEASLLLQCGSFWPDSMVDKSSFLKMLLHILNVETQPDIPTERWEEAEEHELTASGACNASSVVDVNLFVSIGRVAILRVLAKSKQEDISLAATRFVPAHSDEWQLSAPSEPWNEMLAAANPKPARDPDKSLTLSTLPTAVMGEQTPLPLPEDQAGAVVVVDSKQYVLGKRLGRGAGGS
eukprot:5159505-Amphidinium_carterae.1